MSAMLQITDPGFYVWALQNPKLAAPIAAAAVDKGVAAGKEFTTRVYNDAANGDEAAAGLAAVIEDYVENLPHPLGEGKAPDPRAVTTASGAEYVDPALARNAAAVADGVPPPAPEPAAPSNEAEVVADAEASGHGRKHHPNPVTETDAFIEFLLAANILAAPFLMPVMLGVMVPLLETKNPAGEKILDALHHAASEGDDVAKFWLGLFRAGYHQHQQKHGHHSQKPQRQAEASGNAIPTPAKIGELLDATIATGQVSPHLVRGVLQHHPLAVAVGKLLMQRCAAGDQAACAYKAKLERAIDKAMPIASGAVPPDLQTKIGTATLADWLKAIDLHEETGSWVGVLSALVTPDTVHPTPFPLHITTHVQLDQLRQIASEQGEQPSTDALHKAAVHKVAKLFRRVLEGTGWVLPVVDDALPDDAIAAEFATAELNRVVGGASMGEWLKAITFHEDRDSWTGCLSAMVCAVPPAAAARTHASPGHGIARHSHRVDLCIRIPMHSGSPTAPMASGAGSQPVDPSTIDRAALMAILRIFAHVLQGKGWIAPAVDGEVVASGRGFDFWADMLKPLGTTVLGAVIGPQAANAAVNTVEQLGRGIEHAVHPGAKKAAANVQHIVTAAKSGDADAQKAKDTLAALNTAKAAADKAQADLEAAAKQAHQERTQGTVINVYPSPAAPRSPVDTRYIPPPLALVPTRSATPADRVMPDAPADSHAAQRTTASREPGYVPPVLGSPGSPEPTHSSEHKGKAAPSMLASSGYQAPALAMGYQPSALARGRTRAASGAATPGGTQGMFLYGDADFGEGAVARPEDLARLWRRTPV